MLALCAMTRHTLAVLTILLLSLAGCMRHGLPADSSLERRASAAKTTSLPRQFRVATFNVKGEPVDVIGPAIRNDRALREADVILLQEVKRHETEGREWCSSACGLGKELGLHSVYAPAQAMPVGSQGVAILSRAPISKVEVIELPYFDVVFNTGRRIALAATIDVDGEPVTFYAVHLENRVTVKQRRAQMVPILVHAASHAQPIVMGGDFNTSPFTWLGHVIPIPTGTQDNRLEELMRSHGFATPVADSGPTHQALGMKLDAIYTRGFATRMYAVTQADNISDHFALWAEVKRGAE
jgi:endonuclease/exonuclease/phosphatase family metal-dependent hydrolase